MGVRLRTVCVYVFVSACLYGHYVQAVPLEARRGRWMEPLDLELSNMGLNLGPLKE